MSALILALLASVALAGGDNDSTGVLPGMTTGGPGGTGGGNDSGGGTENLVAPVDVSLYAEPAPDAPAAEVGTLQLDRPGTVATGLTSADDPASADVVALDPNQPVRAEVLEDGVIVQGAVSVRLDGQIQARLEAPPEALANSAVLLVESGYPSLPALLDDVVGAGTIHAYAFLGELSSVDLVALDALVKAKAEGLPGTHVSLLVATLDQAGAVHWTAARIAQADGAPMEVVTE